MKDKIEKNGQQGDVIMRKVGDTKPSDGKTIAKGQCIIARGEGHHLHVIDAPDTEAELIQEGERMLLWLAKPASLHHVPAPAGNEPIRLCKADHEVEEYPAGLWEVGGVREIDHFAQMERRVVD